MSCNFIGLQPEMSKFDMSGFYSSAVTKCSLFSIAAASAFVQFSIRNTQNRFRYDVPSILNKRESSIIWLFSLSTALESLSTFAISKYWITLSVLPSGPFFLIYPFFVYYFFDVPNVSVINSFALPISRKLFVCLLGLRLATSNFGSLVVSVCGLLTGLLYRYTFLQRFNLIPSPVAKVVSSILSPIFATNEPKDNQTQIGATLEIQKQEALDRQEQALMNLRRSQFLDRRRRHDYVPQPEHIQLLTEMGFNEELVRQALITTSGDINDAINLLQNPAYFRR